MNVKKLLLSIMIVILLLLPTQGLARSWTSIPEVDWSYTDPNNEDYYDPISQYSAVIRNENVYYFSNDKIHIVNTNIGKHKASIDYLKNSDLFYSFFGSLAQVDNKGNVYAMTATKGSSGVYSYKLTAYNDVGTKLWGKSYNEKIRSIAGVLILDNGSIMTYLETGSERFVTYTYDTKGQLKEKKEWKSYIDGYQNGYYSGITSDGLVIYYKHNSTTDKTTYFAKDSTGKKVWSKEFSGQAGRDTLNDHQHPEDGTFKNYIGGTVGNKFFLVDRKGKTQQLSMGDHYFQTADDQTVMLLNDKKLEIYKASDLSLLHSMKLTEANKDDQFLYAGSGIVYRIDSKNVISKINIANPAVAVYLNGVKQSYDFSTQNINNTIMVPLTH